MLIKSFILKHISQFIHAEKHFLSSEPPDCWAERNVHNLLLTASVHRTWRKAECQRDSPDPSSSHISLETQ